MLENFWETWLCVEWLKRQKFCSTSLICLLTCVQRKYRNKYAPRILIFLFFSGMKSFFWIFTISVTDAHHTHTHTWRMRKRNMFGFFMFHTKKKTFYVVVFFSGEMLSYLECDKVGWINLKFQCSLSYICKEALLNEILFTQIFSKGTNRGQSEWVLFNRIFSRLIHQFRWK